MGRFSRVFAAAATMLVVPAFAQQQPAVALDLMKDLPCALTQTVHSDAGYCLKIFNTCNTPLISRIKEHDGYDKDSPEMRPGERGEVCSAAPFDFVGHYVSSGP